MLINFIDYLPILLLLKKRGKNKNDLPHLLLALVTPCLGEVVPVEEAHAAPRRQTRPPPGAAP